MYRGKQKRVERKRLVSIREDILSTTIDNEIIDSLSCTKNNSERIAFYIGAFLRNSLNGNNNVMILNNDKENINIEKLSDDKFRFFYKYDNNSVFIRYCRCITLNTLKNLYKTLVAN